MDNTRKLKETQLNATSSEKSTRGRLARVINAGQAYLTHDEFANKMGYPEASARTYTCKVMGIEYSEHATRAKREELDKAQGEVVLILAAGAHEETGDIICIVEDVRGEKFMMNEAGLSLLPKEASVNTFEFLANLNKMDDSLFM